MKKFSPERNFQSPKLKLYQYFKVHRLVSVNLYNCGLVIVNLSISIMFLFSGLKIEKTLNI